MNITFILSTFQLSGGVMVVIEYANRLSERGHQITLIAPSDTTDPKLLLALNEKIILKESNVALRNSNVTLSSGRNGGRLLWLVFSLAATVPQSDLIIATHTPTVAPALLAGFVRRKGKLVWFYQDYEEMFAERPVERYFLKNAPPWFRKVFVVSEAGRQDILQNTGLEAIVVGEGLSQPELLYRPPDQPYPPQDTTKYIIYLGDPRPRKGLQNFLQAAEIVYQQLPNIQLVIVSKIPCPIETNIPFEVHVYPSRQKLGHLLRRSHLFVSASWAEGFGLPPLEAMAAGTPVVLTDSGGVWEYARPEENCLLVPPRQPEQLAQAMRRVLQDNTLARALSSQGPKTAKAFEWETRTDLFEAALQQVIESE